MCLSNLFSTPDVPEITPPPPAPPTMQGDQGTGKEAANMERERRRAAARQGFESTWLGKSRMGKAGGGQNNSQANQRPQTVLRQKMGA